jgi:hypothetical protein
MMRRGVRPSPSRLAGIAMVKSIKNGAALVPAEQAEETADEEGTVSGMLVVDDVAGGRNRRGDHGIERDG